MMCRTSGNRYTWCASRRSVQRSSVITLLRRLREGRTVATKRARRDEIWPPQESSNTVGASSSSIGADVDVRSISAGKRPLEPGGDDDVVNGLDVCDELNEYSSDAYVNDCEQTCTDEVTGVTLLRDDVAQACGRDGMVRTVQSL